MAVAFLSGELRQRQIGVGFAAIRDLLGELPSWARTSGRARREARTGHRGPRTDAGADGTPRAGGGQRRAGRTAAADAGRRRRGVRRDRRDQRARHPGRAAAAARRGVQPGHPGRALVPDPAAGRRTAPGRAGRRDERRGGPGGRGKPGGRAPRAPAGRVAARGGRGRAGRWGRRAGRQRGRVGRVAGLPAAGGPSAAAHAGRLGPGVAAAFGRVSPAAVEWKIDGVRIQVHRAGQPGSRVHPEPGRHHRAAARRSPRRCWTAPPSPWSWTARPSRWARTAGPGRSRSPRAGPAPRARAAGRPDIPLTPFFFDLLHLDGRDLIDEPASERQRLLAAVLPEDSRCLAS